MKLIIIIITIIAPLPPIADITWRATDSLLTFDWSVPVAPDCPAIHYNILASNCGSCPTTTNHTTINCTDVPTNHGICTFAVWRVICGNITEKINDTVRIMLPIQERVEDTTNNLSMNKNDALSEAATLRGMLITVTTILQKWVIINHIMISLYATVSLKIIILWCL